MTTVAQTPTGGDTTLQARPFPALAQALVRGLWLYVIPALLAGLALRYLVPAAGAGVAGWVARAGREYPVLFLTALFVAFSALAHYWRFYVPGGRYATSLPAHLAPDERDARRLRAWAELAESYRSLSSISTRRSLASLGPEKMASFEQRLEELRSALSRADAERAAAADEGARDLAAPTQAARTLRQAIRTGAGLVAGLAFLVALRGWVAQPYRILSSSMLPTLEPSDRILANKLAYGLGGREAFARPLPARGDVVVFRSSAVALGPGQWPEFLVKRVIGLPGDRIEMDAGFPVVNGWKVPNCTAGRYAYLIPDGEGSMLQAGVRVEFLGDRAYLTAHSIPMPRMKQAYVVPPGEVFVLGDDRANSLDSRSWHEGMGGAVPLSAIEGRAQWFLVGTHRSGDADFGRFLKPIDSAMDRLHVEGMDTGPLQAGIARCLRERPKETTPPAAGTDLLQTPSPSNP